MNHKESVIYLAGILDGEGHFYKPMTVNGRGEHSPQARIVMNNTCLELIEWCKENFGGGITAMRKQKPHYKQCWRWELRGSVVETLAVELQPYLIVKAEQVKRVL